MAANTEVCNLAIAHIGIGSTIVEATTEKSAEARVCRIFYDIALDSVLRDYDWPFATKIETLELVERNPNNEWCFSYRYPSDCVRFRHIQNRDTRVPGRQDKEPFRIISDDSGKLILSDQDSAIGEYTSLITESARFDGDFKLLLSYRLAAYIAPQLTKGDPFSLIEKAKSLYQMELANAIANAKLEQQPDCEPRASFRRFRDQGKGVTDHVDRKFRDY